MLADDALCCINKWVEQENLFSQSCAILGSVSASGAIPQVPENFNVPISMSKHNDPAISCPAYRPRELIMEDKQKNRP